MKTDARIRYTRAIIRSSFLKLLRQKPVSRITVTELCREAEINRATFYAHYNDCYDLLRSIENDFLEQFKQTGKTAHWCDSRELISAIYDTIAENFEICDTLIFNVKNPALLTRMIETAREYCMVKWRTFMTMLTENEQNMLFIHLSTGLSAVIYENFKTCDRKTLIDFMVAITDNCLAPYRSDLHA